LRGYYFEASLLERDLIEGMGLCSLFKEDENKASMWIRDERLIFPSDKLHIK
jgi:hypothetical protein